MEQLNMFKEINMKVEKAKLINEIIKKTNDNVTQDDIKLILSNIDNDNIKNYRPIFTQSAEEFSRYCIRQESMMYSNETLNFKSKLKIDVLLGDSVTTGYEECNKYITECGKEYSSSKLLAIPDFDINKKSILIQKYDKVDIEDVNIASEYFIIIYVPDANPYKIDYDILKTIKEFNI